MEVDLEEGEFMRILQSPSFIEEDNPRPLCRISRGSSPPPPFYLRFPRHLFLRLGVYLNSTDIIEQVTHLSGEQECREYFTKHFGIPPDSHKDGNGNYYIHLSQFITLCVMLERQTSVYLAEFVKDLISQMWTSEVFPGCTQFMFHNANERNKTLDTFKDEVDLRKKCYRKGMDHTRLVPMTEKVWDRIESTTQRRFPVESRTHIIPGNYGFIVEMMEVEGELY